MSIEVSTIGRVRVARESTFATQVDFSASDDGTATPPILSVPVTEGSVSFKLDQTTLDPKALVAFLDQKHENVLGPRSGTLSITVPAISPGTTADAAAHTRNALGLILRDVMGGENLGESMTIASNGGSPDSYTVTGTVGGNYITYPGSVVGVPIGSAGVIEWRKLRTESSSTANLALAVSDTIVNAGLVHGCSTYYLTENPSNSLQFAIYGAESDDRWQFLGCQLQSMSISMAFGEIVSFTFNFRCANWLHGSASSALPTAYEVTNAITGALSAYTYSNANYIVNTGGHHYFWTIAGGGSTAAYSSSISKAIASETWNINLAFDIVPSPAGTNGVSRFKRKRQVPVVSGSFSLPYEDVSYFDQKVDSDNMAILRVINGVAGTTMVLDAPTVQVVDVQRNDENGLAYQTISWEARHDADVSATAGGADELERSAFRIHFG